MHPLQEHARAVRARIEAPRAVVEKPRPRPFGITDEAHIRLYGFSRENHVFLPNANDHVLSYYLFKVEQEKETRPDVYSSPKVSVTSIIRIVCGETAFRFADIVSERRTRTLVRPRQVVMYLAKRYTACSLPMIGRSLGGRDHTTVLHGIGVIERLLATGDAFIADLVIRSELRIKAMLEPTSEGVRPA